MQFTATIIAATALFSAASAGPIVARQVCGAIPGGATAQAPLSSPSGISTAADCATQCKTNPSCQSFLFGLSNGADVCQLFSVPASSVPAQGSLVAYDIGCSSIPSIVPTASNPGGIQQQQKHRRQQNGAPGAASGNNNNNNNGANNGGAAANQGTHANPMNAAPAGNPTPIATPAVNDLAACLAACQGNSACVAYTFVSGTCKLFS